MMLKDNLIEIFKIWYSIFCALMDDPSTSQTYKMEKLRGLRQQLKEGLPDVEEYIKRLKQ